MPDMITLVMTTPMTTAKARLLIMEMPRRMMMMMMMGKKWTLMVWRIRILS